MTIIAILLCLLIPSYVLSAEQDCQSYLHKLRVIQSEQKLPQSGNKSNRLKISESKAREKWWQCQRGKLKVSKTKPVKKTRAKQDKNTPQTRAALLFSDSQRSAPFKTEQAIVIKNDFTGEKQRHWLKYYRQPAYCLQPKNLKVFAYCMEDKLLQKQTFEQLNVSDK